MIYCVEDDNSIRDLIIYTLESAGFQAEGFGNGEELFEVLNTATPELIMLDIMLPGEDGLSILKRIKSNASTKSIPVIMATAKGTEYDTVKGLDLGADDYLAKPFGMMEMVSRVRAVLRRAGSKDGKQMLKNGDISMYLDEHRVTVKGDSVALTLKEFELLRTLMENPGMVFTREQLLDMIWGIEFVGETRTVDVHIGTLRTKLGNQGKLIETVRGVGYRMEVMV